MTEIVVDLVRHPEAAPVLILEGALAEHSPARTAELAPDTLLDFRDALIPARALVNGVSVLRLGAVGQVRYLQLETSEHEINVVDGVRVASLLTSTAPCRRVCNAVAEARAWSQVSQRTGILHEGGWRAGVGMAGMSAAPSPWQVGCA